MNKYVLKLPSSVGKKRSIASEKESSKIQSHLNFGQISKKSRITCTQCGMVYMIGVVADEKAHSRLCSKQSVDTVVKISGIGNYRVVHRYDIGEFVIECKTENVNNSMKALFEKMNKDLGSPAGFHEGGVSAYVYVKDSNACGCLVLDKIHYSKVISISNKTVDIATPIIVACCEQGKEKCNRCLICSAKMKPDDSHYFTLGVRQIWVARNCRKTGMAGKMLDCARKAFVLGNVYGRNEVAFSQPTEDGLAFAKQYTKNEKILVYS